MKALTLTGLLLALALLWSSVPGHARAMGSDLLALHWHPETATEARRRTLALGLWLDSGEVDPAQWRSAVDTRMLALERAAARVPPDWAPPSDGILGWLVHARERHQAHERPALASRNLARASGLLGDDHQAGRLARLHWLAAIEAEAIWQDLADRLAALPEPEDEDESLEVPAINDFWLPLREGLDPSDGEALLVHARAQADRVRRLAEVADDDGAYQQRLARLWLAEARLMRDLGRELAAVWLYFDGLVRLAAADESVPLAAEYQDDLVEWTDTGLGQLRRLDIDLPVVLAQMQDAAGYLAVVGPDRTAAVAELSDAYARLVLFASDIGFYLDQPVREDVRQVIADCNPDPALVGPVPREVFDICLQRLTTMMVSEIDHEELVGGSGPFAPEFLRRETGLVSWQRAAYLDGHLDWRLQSGCGVPQWLNALEWSILAQYLAHWVPQRPIFFDTTRWRDATEAIVDVLDDSLESRSSWIDCLTGMGGQRRDPILRLLDHLERAHGVLATVLQEAQDQFHADVTRPGADLDLDRPADQVTAYRPEGLLVRPCPELETCGARAELPVSRALLSRFPNAYLLADQLAMGSLQLCYGNVGWVQRETRPARAGDERVVNYHGHLSFELIGSFVRDDEADVIFRQRLVASEGRHYLFAAADPALLDLSCPHGLAGDPIASELPPGRPPLVPNRLTYFVSLPTTAEAQLIANWDRGAEWRDWFLTGDRVEVLEQQEGIELALTVEAELSSLASRRERQLAGRLLNPILPSATDPVSLAMAEIVEYGALLRRLLELHYPRVLRHDDEVRSLVNGEAGMINRDRIRHLRDAGQPMLQVPGIGRERLERLRQAWLDLPTDLRESGQVSPELDHGRELLDELMAISRRSSVSGESSPDP
ncbi:MAG: hypothetical protein EA370_09755 [Wenzhouxiangella sp.]|nr:MAG: hypothetical protein EA370_09755 [Wenzhouxiangella sp.]